jgi:hypothetical protein
VQDLEGLFLNHKIGEIAKPVRIIDSILSIFNIREFTDFVTIVAKSPNEIKLIYYNDSSERREKVFEGEMKENFFEIYLSNEQFVIPLFFGNWNIDRLRIGKTEDRELIIRRFIDHRGHLLMLAGGTAYELVGRFSLATSCKGYKNEIK